MANPEYSQGNGNSRAIQLINDRIIYLSKRKEASVDFDGTGASGGSKTDH